MKKAMKILLMIIVLLVLILTGVAIFIRHAKDNILDGPGMINPDHVVNALKNIQGEYEYSFGERIVIEGCDLKIKDQGEYSFETTVKDAYEVQEYEGRIILELENTHVNKNGRDFAMVNQCYYENKAIHIFYEFSFGERELIYEYAEQPEFYYYDIVTEEYMPRLEGTWENGSTSMVITNNTVTFYYDGEKMYEPENVCVIRENGEYSKRVFLADKNLYLDGVGAYSRFEFRDGRLYASMQVLDEDSSVEEFIKK